MGKSRGKSREMQQHESLLHSVLEVDGAIQGGLRWKVKTGHHAAGTQAGNDNGNGYWQVTFRGVKLLSSRVVWILTHGQIPDDMEVDHKDGNRSNNHPDNLQLLTGSVNGRGYNKLFSRNTSGYMGVCYVPDRRKWLAGIKRDGRHITIGRYPTAIEAAKAYNDYAIKWAEAHNETPRFLNPV